MPHIQPMVIAIWCGPYSKLTNLNDFLQPFVNEMSEILSDGIIVNDHHISVKFRCFICDTPARSFIKGSIYHLIIFARKFI